MKKQIMCQEKECSDSSIFDRLGYTRKSIDTAEEHDDIKRKILSIDKNGWVPCYYYEKDGKKAFFQNWSGDGLVDSSNPRSMPLKIKGIEIIEF
jgi:hypothetical protein